MTLHANTIAIERLREAFTYNPKTGVVAWRETGEPIVIAEGYYPRAGTVWFDGRTIGLHRIAWALHYGRHATLHIDHINCDPADNRICNLREATARQNCFNRPRKSNNTTGYKGVTRTKSGRYVAQIRAGVTRYLGTFDTPQEAHAAYCAAGRLLHGEFFNSGETP